MDGYNRTRFIEALLERNKSELPSFSIHLYPENWTINSGTKFLYNDFRYSSFLDEVRAHRIPTDYMESFQDSGVRYFEGCLIVDLFDYRPQKPTDPALDVPERTREILHPNSETLWADLCLVNVNSGGKLTDLQALEIEARILLATSAPLCLDPDPHLTRIANNVLRVSTPAVPASLKRKASALSVQKDETEKARKEKIMQFMAPASPRTSKQFRLLDARQRIQEEKEQARRVAAAQSQQQPTSRASSQPRAPSHTPVPPSQTPAYVSNHSSNHSSPVPPPSTSQYIQAQSPTDPTRRSVNYVPNRVNGGQTPVSSNSHHSPSPQPHYPNAQAGMEVSAKRTPTPAQQRYSQSPRVQHIQPSISQNIAVQSHASPRVQPQQLPSVAQASPRPPSTHPQIPPQQQHVSIQQQLPQSAQLSQQPQVPTPRQTATTAQTFQPPVTNFIPQLPLRGRKPSNPVGQTVDATVAAATQAYSLQQQQNQRPNRLIQQQPMIQAGQPQPQQQAMPIQIAQGAAVTRASPRITNDRLATRSPMPSSLSNGGQTVNASAVAVTNSPRPRTMAPAGPAPTGGVNSPRLLPQGHLIPAGYQNAQYRPMHNGVAALQAQPQAQPQQHPPSASIPISSPSEGDTQVHVSSQQRPVQPAQTPKMQQQQLATQLQQQQRRATPSQVPNAQQQQQQLQPQPQPQPQPPQPPSQQPQQGQPYPMYTYGVPQTGYSASQIPPQYYVRGVPIQPGQMSAQQLRQLQHMQTQQYALAQQAHAQQAQHKAQGGR